MVVVKTVIREPLLETDNGLILTINRNYYCFVDAEGAAMFRKI
tara:strand:- start:19225 stop:19353 length:129 start_codon:yes stop_codon:yes gene_type:complete